MLAEDRSASALTLFYVKLHLFYTAYNYRVSQNNYVKIKIVNIVLITSGEPNKGGCIYYVVIAYKNNVRRAKKKVRPPPDCTKKMLRPPPEANEKTFSPLAMVNQPLTLLYTMP